MLVSKVAAEFRQRFKKDVVIDVVGYRRYGHNEIDNPMFTQPLMYQKIASHPAILQKYGEVLVNEGVMTVPKQQKRQEHQLESLARQPVERLLPGRSRNHP